MIPKNSELVILDFYNTLVVESEDKIKLRDDIFSQIVRLRLKGKKIAISSSSPLEEILNFPEFLKIRTFIWGIYGKEHIIKENGKEYKNLGLICKEMKTEPENAVMIGDNYKKIDEESSKKFGVQFVPYKNES